MESGWFVVIGAAVGVIPTLLTGWLTKRAEKQKQLREMALKVALAEHERTMEIAKFTKGPKVIPLLYAHTDGIYGSKEMYVWRNETRRYTSILRGIGSSD